MEGSTSPTSTYIGDNAPEEFLPYISKHWLKFLAPDPRVNYVLGIIYIFFMIFSLLGNGLILFLIIRCPSLQTCSNCLVGSLALADFLMMLKSPIFIVQSFHQGPTLGSLGCQVFGAMGSLSGFAAIWSVTAISVHRYLVFEDPFDKRKRFGRIGTAGVIACIWSSSALITVAPFVGFSRYVPEVPSECKLFICVNLFIPSCQVFGAMGSLSGFAAIWSVTAISVHRYLVFADPFDKRKRFGRIGLQGKLNRVVILVVVIWVLSWTPYAAVVLIGAVRSQYLTPGMSMIPALACKTSACINPYIYGIRNPHFMMEVKRLFFRRRARTPSYRRELIPLSDFRSRLGIPDSV
ncbi:unnamed protein product [Darwinula stevensoni]|uniref:G-protein coupled receptors family 1 profile domain-containing protein n=1 Tax=Darwinula stevensoni TaxID=69355 RepID=A0A7R9A4A9_9CRUS|nr:unnamed protein product [Darwinula stevensoni]CAG0883900.1 unnamed protein product [Darwinula stevensoni]